MITGCSATADHNTLVNPTATWRDDLALVVFSQVKGIFGNRLNASSASRQLR